MSENNNNNEGVLPVFSPYVLGIDLGTSNSSAYVYYKGNNSIIPLYGKYATMASVVLFENRDLNEIKVGNEAKEYILIKPNEVFSSVKSLMKDETWKEDQGILEKHTFDNNIVTPTQIAGEILRAIKNYSDLDERFSEYGTFNKVCISVPANSLPTYKRNVMKAAEIAGFGEVDEYGNVVYDKDGNVQGVILIEEPTAAAIAYGLENGFFTDNDKEQNILVYDFGGGTFDVTILNIVSTNGKTLPKFNVKATNGLSILGGDTIDWAIIESIKSQIADQTGYDIFDLVRDQNGTTKKELRSAQSKLKVEAEKAKIAFSAGINKIDISIPNLFKDGNGKILSFECVLDKSEFIQIVAPIINQTIDCVESTLAEANINIDDINRIVLVGGSCKGQWVKDKISNHFQREPFIAENVDTIVSQGNAYYGSLKLNSLCCPKCNNELSIGVSEQYPCSNCGYTGGDDINDEVVNNITSHTYGIEIQGGYFAPMIEKGLLFDNDTTEHSYTRVFGNVGNSHSVMVTGYVTQEPIEIVEENSIKKTSTPVNVHQKKGDEKIFTCIGEFELKGIPKAPAGTIAIELKLTVKNDNSICVTAKTGDGEDKNVYWKN